MPLNVMKSETLEEARERLMEQTRLEKEGFDAVTEGQLTELTRLNTRFVGEEHQDLIDEEHEARDRLRMAPTMQDRADDDSVEWAKRAVKNDRDVTVAGEPAKARKAARKSGNDGQA